MSAGADYTIGAMVSQDAAIAAFSCAYGIPADRIALLPDPVLQWPDADVVLDLASNSPLPGDYPIQIVTWDSDQHPQSAVASSLAVVLGAPVLIGAESYDPEDLELHLPDGTASRVRVKQDDDDGFRNTPEMRRLIAASQSRMAHSRAA